MEKVKIYRNIAKLKDIDMFYFDTRTEGPVILCLHGRYGRAETWYDFINQYGKEYRIIAPDQRGHGLTSKPESGYTAEEMGEDIIELLKYLNIDSIILVGHSMGGAIAGHLAALHPEYIKAVAILDESAADGSDGLSPDECELGDLGDPFTRDWPMPFATLNEAMNFLKEVSGSGLEYQYFMNSLVETADGYSMMFSQRAMALIRAHMDDWFDILSDIKCPAMLVRSGSHRGIPDEDFAKMQSMVPDCIAFEMSDPDHNVHLANKEEFYRYFDQFTLSL
jgi:pimeloyl-ACP methyl ester carboxylesterase